MRNVCVQTNEEALGAVHPVGEPAPGESGGSGPAGQAAALRPPAEADRCRGHAAPILLLVLTPTHTDRIHVF